MIFLAESLLVNINLLLVTWAYGTIEKFNNIRRNDNLYDLCGIKEIVLRFFQLRIQDFEMLGYL